MKCKAILSAILALGLSTAFAEDAAGQQGNKSGSKTQHSRKATKRSRQARPADDVTTTTIGPVQPQTGEPQVTMPLLPEDQRNKPRVRIVPAPPPGTVPQPPAPPKTQDAER